MKEANRPKAFLKRIKDRVPILQKSGYDQWNVWVIIAVVDRQKPWVIVLGTAGTAKMAYHRQISSSRLIENDTIFMQNHSASWIATLLSLPLHQPPWCEQKIPKQKTFFYSNGNKNQGVVFSYRSILLTQTRT